VHSMQCALHAKKKHFVETVCGGNP
jgi:hypothetical protein